MRLRLSILFSLLLTACIGVNTGSSHDAGTAAVGTATDATTATADAAKGVDCIVEQTTGATICSVNSLCPSVVVNHDVFPNCGFRVKGGTLDIECACNGYLCPLGVPATCTQAAEMLKNQTEATVCAQIGESRCVAGNPVVPMGKGTCDKVCASECGGDPNCLIGCGC